MADKRPHDEASEAPGASDAPAVQPAAKDGAGLDGNTATEPPVKKARLEQEDGRAEPRRGYAPIKAE